jgi:capsular polysaccharide export protein
MNITSLYKKTKKLFRSPKKFFSDSKFFGQTPSVSPSKPESAEDTSDILVEISDNPNDNSKKLAVLFGFAPWKYEFIGDYLKNYRILCIRQGVSWNKVCKELDKLEDFTFFVWSYSDARNMLNQYAERRNINIIRVEDGFLRSVDLGKIHSKPYSLTFDHSGLYFNADQPSDIENLLQNYDFAADEKLTRKTKALLSLFRSMNLSKYNIPCHIPVSSILGPKIRKRVLVLGQVMADASIRYGRASEWNSDKLLNLAIHENPNAEILYRPHPDLKDTKKGTFSVPERVNLFNADVSLGELFSHVDNVYVITSLSGFEALLHGLKVTVVGMPFYAGWGLTDDRQRLDRRTRTLTMEELFCGAYLLYPQYLLNADDPVEACLATMLRLYAERYMKILQNFSDTFITKNFAILGKTEYWPILLTSDHFFNHINTYGKKFLSAFPLQTVFSREDGPFWQKTMTHYLAGLTRKNPAAFAKFISAIHPLISNEAYKELLRKLWSTDPSKHLLSCWARACEKEQDYVKAYEALSYITSNQALPNPGYADLPIPKNNWAYALELARLDKEQKKLAAATERYCDLLLSGCSLPGIFQGLAEIAYLRFDFTSARKLWTLVALMYPAYKPGKARLEAARNMVLSRDDVCGIIQQLSLSCWEDISLVVAISSISNIFQDSFTILPLEISLSQMKTEDNIILKAKASISNMYPQNAERLLLSYKPSKKEIISYSITMSMALSYQKKYNDAINIMKNINKYYSTPQIYREILRIGIMSGDYNFCSDILCEAKSKNIDVGDMYIRKVNIGCLKIKDSYATFREMKFSRILKFYLNNKYTQSIDNFEKTAKYIMVVSCFGPGDEIRFASFYKKISYKLSEKTVCFTCDPRLLKLLRRGYPELVFHPVKRIRSLLGLKDFRDYQQLPASELHVAFDNTGWAIAQKMDKVILSTDILGDIIDDKSSFAGTPFLKADPDEVTQWQERLEPLRNSMLLIGISWRSSLVSSARNEHYLTIQELSPLFEVPGILFVNLQYDECSEEVAWVEQHYPGKLIHFAELDQYNDLDGTAALMKALDLVISPATTVAELAGALGCPTWLLSNSSELHWRKKDNSDVDVWYNTVRHIEGSILGNKESMVCNLINQIKNIEKEYLIKQVKQLRKKINTELMTERWKSTTSKNAERLDYSYKNNALDRLHEKNFINIIHKYCPQPCSILDVGSGTGALAIKLYDNNYDVTCIDISNEMVSLFNKNKKDRNIKVILSDIFTYKSKYQFDAIICRYVFPHYNEFSILIESISKHMRKGGLLFFDSFSKDSIECASSLCHESYQFIHDHTFQNLASFSKNDLEKICKKLNLDIISRIPLSLYHRNPYFSIGSDISEYDSKLEYFCSKDDVMQFLDYMQTSCIAHMPPNISGNYINVLLKK